MKYLGLDLGYRTLGVAISTSGIFASNLKVIRHNEEYDRLIKDVKDIVDEYKIDIIVLGLPKNMNGSIGEKGELSYKFKEMLEKGTSLEVILEDERLSTKEATNLLIKNDTSRKKRKKVIDSLAATIILQSYLDRKNKKEEV